MKLYLRNFSYDIIFLLLHMNYLSEIRPNSRRPNFKELSVPWFLPLIMGTKGKREDGKGGEEKQRQRENMKSNLRRQQFQVPLGGPHRAFGTVY